MTLLRRNGSRHLDAVLLSVAVWIWWIPGAYFWQVADAHGAMLPILPQAIWIAPGSVWSVAPAVGVAVPLLTLLTFWARPPLQDRLRPVRCWAVASIVVSVLSILIWGGALMSASAGGTR